MRIRHYEPWQLTCQNHDNTSSELRELHSVDYMLHLQDGVHTYVPEPLTAPQLVVPHGQRGSTLTHTMHHDGLPVPTGKSKPPTGKGGRSNRLTQTDNHMHHTSISIVILGKHIATMLRHNPYSLLRSTARTNLVERSYSQFFLLFYEFKKKKKLLLIFAFLIFFFLIYFIVWFLYLVSHFVFPFLSLTLNPLTKPWIQVLKLRSTSVSKVVVIRCENRCRPIEATRQNYERHDTRCKFLDWQRSHE